MSDQIKELVKRLREGKFARLQIAGPYPDQYVYAVDTEKTHLRAADALETMAGEVDKLKWSIMEWYEDRAEAAEAERDRLAAELKTASQLLHDTAVRESRLKAALVRLRDCDWVISLPDRMDAVREIARKALGGDAS